MKAAQKRIFSIKNDNERLSRDMAAASLLASAKLPLRSLEKSRLLILKITTKNTASAASLITVFLSTSPQSKLSTARSLQPHLHHTLSILFLSIQPIRPLTRTSSVLRRVFRSSSAFSDFQAKAIVPSDERF